MACYLTLCSGVDRGLLFECAGWEGARRGGQRGVGGGFAGGGGWLHDAGGHDQLSCDQREPLSEDRLRPDQVVRAGDADRHQSCRAGGAAEQPPQDAEGRAGRQPGQVGRAIVGFCRHRYVATPVARTAGLQVGGEVHARALQGQRAGDPGHHRRADRHDVRHHRGGGAAHPERQAARDRGDLVETAGLDAGRADDRRIQAAGAFRLRGGVVAGDLRARGYAAAGGGPAAQRDPPDPRATRDAGKDERLRHGTGRHDDHPDRGVPEGRGRQVGAGDQGRQHQGRVGSVLRAEAGAVDRIAHAFPPSDPPCQTAFPSCRNTSSRRRG
ncbi:hypothetical protein VARIO8X_100047 [Burkholderiales bacterium 8X]|nr:hypothetical protein VARIO8X_100047 [Burkholderiales bacterium 8X]